jgi:ComF family protein
VLARILTVLAPRLCVACGRHAGRAEPLCAECRPQLARSVVTAPGSEVWSAFAYEGPAVALVRALKFGGRVALAECMAAQIAAYGPPVQPEGALVPVPLHPARLRSRGFNQAELLARSLAARTGMPVADCLARGGDRAAQIGRRRADRIRALPGSVAVVGPPPARALLVDDVVTTGATLRACGKALTAAGCNYIGAITYARTGGR